MMKITMMDETLMVGCLAFHIEAFTPRTVSAYSLIVMTIIIDTHFV